MKKEGDYREMIKITTKEQVKNIGKYLAIVKSKWLNKIKQL